MKPRSILYTSAIRPERFANLAASGAHVGVIDLEDGVPPSAREAARSHLATYLGTPAEAMSRAVRINPIDSLDGLRDLLFLGSQRVWPDCLILSMTPAGSHVEILRTLLDEMAPRAHPRILVTIERPDAVANLSDIAGKVDGLIFGSADYCASLGISISGGDKLRYAQCAIVNASARYGIPAYDTACFRIESAAALEDESEQAKELGFFGKTAVHPSQIPTINRIFTPTAQQILEAKQLIRSYEDAGMGIVRGGEGMIGPPFYKLAKKLLEVSA
jgi:(S)-citramalyl-CoA lyase